MRTLPRGRRPARSRMSSPSAPSPLMSLLRDLGGLSALILVALALLVLSIWLESPPGHSLGPHEWLASLDADRAANLLGVAAQLVAGVLAIVITVAAIVVELAANRYTSRITQLFVREPVNFLLMGLYVVTTLLCLWLSAVPALDADAPSRVPRAGLVIGLALVSVCLAALLPYFGFLFRFLEPTNVISRIRGLAVESIQRAHTRSVPDTQRDRDRSHRRARGRGAQRARAQRPQHLDGGDQRARGPAARVRAAARRAAGELVRSRGPAGRTTRTSSRWRRSRWPRSASSASGSRRRCCASTSRCSARASATRATSRT